MKADELLLPLYRASPRASRRGSAESGVATTERTAACTTADVDGLELISLISRSAPQRDD